MSKHMKVVSSRVSVLLRETSAVCVVPAQWGPFSYSCLIKLTDSKTSRGCFSVPKMTFKMRLYLKRAWDRALKTHSSIINILHMTGNRLILFSAEGFSQQKRVFVHPGSSRQTRRFLWILLQLFWSFRRLSLQSVFGRCVWRAINLCEKIADTSFDRSLQECYETP